MNPKLVVVGAFLISGAVAWAVWAAGTGEGIKGFTDVRLYIQTITPASVAANTCAEQTFTVTGLRTTDTVVINVAGITAGTAAGSPRVSANNTLAVAYCNNTAGPLTPNAGSYRIVAIRHP